MAEQPSGYGGESHACAQCGTTLEPGTRFCPNCGTGVNQTSTPGPPFTQEGAYPHQVPNYMMEAILVTVIGFFCCFPVGLGLGIVSLVFASQVNGKLASGDFDGAVRYSNRAKTWAWVSFGVTLAGLIIAFLFVVVSFFLAI
ncbi:MAG: CD225/dispanin family protein [Dehalococcoidia bacterium]